MRSLEIFKRHLKEKRAVKIIAGIDNFDLTNVANVCRAAQIGLASAVDVSCDESVIKTAKENTKLPVFVSSTQPFNLKKAVKWGADAIEVGNFDALYKNGVEFGADEVYEIALETMTLTENDNIFTCVTIPGSISIEEQIELAKKLELIGVDLIQTEGVKPKQAVKGAPASELISVAQMTIANTMEISKRVNVPVMTASGITPQTAPLAFAAGASAVGVGSAVNKLRTQIAMAQTVRELVGTIAYKELIKKETASRTASF
ncbi:MAG: DUF561 domain-containing protein [Candidatus Gastranaerophilales bacterium]|nr:DUF561 domain-containing protein [Candidatus Gastranaerophilales bacterium]